MQINDADIKKALMSYDITILKFGWNKVKIMHADDMESLCSYVENVTD